MGTPTPDSATRREEFEDLCQALLEGDIEERGLTGAELELLRAFMDEEELQSLLDAARRALDQEI